MQCPACGAEIAEDAVACSACGTLSGSIGPGTRLAGRYEIQALLGAGALGRVFRAHDLTLNEIVAIKVLHPGTTRTAELTQRFRNEIRLARRVRHVNVCAIHEYGEDGPVQFVAMELVDGADLQRVLRESGPLPAAEVFDVALQMARGLAAIHDAGVIHRDLKTSNIVRDRRGAVRLLDFGIAKRSTSTGTLALTGGERVVGTPEFMSPEQIRGAELDPRSDIYSFGVVVFELCTGTLPFEGKTALDTMLRQVSEPPPLYGDRAARIPPALVSLLHRTLAKDPGGRPGSARELEAELLFARTAMFPEAIPASTHPSVPPSDSAPQLVEPRREPEPADRTEILPRKLSPRRPTPPPPHLLAARDAAAAAALDAERTYIELPAVPGLAPPFRRAPPMPDPDPALPARPVRRRLPLALLAGVGLAVIALALVLRSRLEPEADPVPAASTTPSAAQAPGVEGSQPMEPAPLPTVVPPEAGPDQAASTPSPVPTATPTPEAIPIPAPVATPAVTPPRRAVPTPTPAAALPTPAPTPPPPARARLAIGVRPRAEVEVDGRPYGPAPLAEITVEPGEHAIELVHPDYWPRRKRVVLFPGSVLQLDVDLAWEGIRRRRGAAPYRLPSDGPVDLGLQRGVALIAEMECRDAVTTLEEVVRRLKAQPRRRNELARAHFYLGVAHLELDEPTRATASFIEAVEKDGKLRPPPAGFSPRVLSFFNHVRTTAKK
jgi:serine/threonine protein kinase